jgi:2-polyprenyl-6-methoxyphenol hydroxylase-like FAD-dependent oxidoreductase
MRFVVAGGGVAGLACALAVARAGHRAVVLERDVIPAGGAPADAFDVPRRGIPHFQQPHAFLPRGRRVLRDLAPDVLEVLLDAGAEPQDLATGLHGPREPDDEDLVYLWVRRPLIEWALRRAAAAEPGVELRSGTQVTGILAEKNPGRAVGVTVAGAEPVRGDVVVDALGRYRCPVGWPRARTEPTDSGAIYYCRYFRLAEGAEHLAWPLLNPRGDLGYLGFNTFRGDNRTYAIILLTPTTDRELRVLRDERAWMSACAAIRPLDQITAPDHGVPITAVMPMGGLMNADRFGDPGMRRVVAVGDALCHTDPAFAYGVSFALIHAQALAQAVVEAADADEVRDRFMGAVEPEARERYELACATDAARGRRWAGEALDVGNARGCYELFGFTTAIAAAPHDDAVLRRTVRRIGLLDRTAEFDRDAALHARIEEIFAGLMHTPQPPPGPPRDQLLAALSGALTS